MYNIPTVVAIVAVDDESYGYVLSKEGEDFDLLIEGNVLEDNGVSIPKDCKMGVYKCTNFRTTNQYEDHNGEINYDVECDWEPLYIVERIKR